VVLRASQASVASDLFESGMVVEVVVPAMVQEQVQSFLQEVMPTMNKAARAGMKNFFMSKSFDFAAILGKKASRCIFLTKKLFRFKLNRSERSTEIVWR
jgi:hypothetical protein